MSESNCASLKNQEVLIIPDLVPDCSHPAVFLHYQFSDSLTIGSKALFEVSCDSIKWRYEHRGFSSSADQLIRCYSVLEPPLIHRFFFVFYFNLSLYGSQTPITFHISQKHPDFHMQSGDVRIIIIIPHLQKRLPNTILKPTQKKRVSLLLSYFRWTEMSCTLILAGGRPAGGHYLTEVSNKMHLKEN